MKIFLVPLIWLLPQTPGLEPPLPDAAQLKWSLTFYRAVLLFSRCCMYLYLNHRKSLQILMCFLLSYSGFPCAYNAVLLHQAEKCTNRMKQCYGSLFNISAEISLMQWEACSSITREMLRANFGYCKPSFK